MNASARFEANATEVSPPECPTNVARQAEDEEDVPEETSLERDPPLAPPLLVALFGGVVLPGVLAGRGLRLVVGLGLAQVAPERDGRGALIEHLVIGLGARPLVELGQTLNHRH